jgi:hypothetical protein
MMTNVMRMDGRFIKVCGMDRGLFKTILMLAM